MTRVLFNNKLIMLRSKTNYLIYFFLFSVRDSVARLPNGEGNRAEICELLKDSQFLAPGITDAQVR